MAPSGRSATAPSAATHRRPLAHIVTAQAVRSATVSSVPIVTDVRSVRAAMTVPAQAARAAMMPRVAPPVTVVHARSATVALVVPRVVRAVVVRSVTVALVARRVARAPVARRVVRAVVARSVMEVPAAPSAMALVVRTVRTSGAHAPGTTSGSRRLARERMTVRVATIRTSPRM